jgi:uncharacterized protein YdaU (DUF1376 family)
MIFVNWFMGDYLRDTIHLTWLEDCAYRRMLDLYYSTGKSLTTDRQKLYRQLRAVADEEKIAVESVLSQYFYKHHQKMVNSRASIEVRKYEKLRALHVKGGKQRAKQAAQAQLQLSYSSAFPNPNPNPEPNPEKPTRNTGGDTHIILPTNTPPSKTGSVCVSPAFDKFWRLYPNHLDASAAWAAWCEIPEADRKFRKILVGLNRWKNSGRWSQPRYVPSAGKFLSDHRWTKAPPKGETDGQTQTQEAIAKAVRKHRRADRQLGR